MDNILDRKKARILVVDDEPYVCVAISRWLKNDGYECVCATSVDDALKLLAKGPFELLVSDILMPGKSGMDLLRLVRKELPDMAVMMATGVEDRTVAIEALQLGAYGYMIKPFDRNEFQINISSVLERRRLVIESRDYEKRLEADVLARTEKIRQREEELVFRLLKASEFRDDETKDHVRRVGLFSSAVARDLCWGQDDVENIKLAAPMHDVGKIGIAEKVLLKPAKLTKEEFEQVKKHSEIGSAILGNTDIPLLQFASSIARHHHEKWDGTGYPEGLRQGEIPEAARIVAIMDVYDSLVSERVYRPAYSEKDALALMKKERGKHFDPQIFQCFMDLLPEIREIRQSVSSAPE
jgi:putative two-component system response regulator